MVALSILFPLKVYTNVYTERVYQVSCTVPHSEISPQHTSACSELKRLSDPPEVVIREYENHIRANVEVEERATWQITALMKKRYSQRRPTDQRDLVNQARLKIKTDVIRCEMKNIEHETNLAWQRHWNKCSVQYVSETTTCEGENEYLKHDYMI